MGRPPCCDKVGIKKGPWTPEEDIILASYIQEHGPGNWRSVPTNTGLLRCSKSCRLRWTNYLRPGIKRGNFTPHEERMIIHLQALLGNKWAAIASYLPQRTDNDIKNYWNTHLKKKIKKFQSVLHPHLSSSSSSSSSTSSSSTFQLFNKSYSTSTEKRSSLLTDMTHHHHQISSISKSNPRTSSSTTNTTTTTTTTTTTYASSTENISRLLEGWMKSPPKTASNTVKKPSITTGHEEKVSNTIISATKVEEQSCDDPLISHEEFESLLSFDENISNIAWDQNKSSSSSPSADDDSNFDQESHDEDDNDDKNTTTTGHIDEKLETMSSEEDQQQQQQQQHDDHHQDIMENQPPFSLLEKWLLDEATTAGQVLEEMELSPMF